MQLTMSYFTTVHTFFQGSHYSVRFGLDPGRGQASTHSLYIEILAETGLVGLAFFLLLLGVMFSTIGAAMRILRDIGETDEAGMFSALRTAMIGYLFVAAFLHDAYPRYFWLLFGISMATLNVARTELAQYREQRSHAR